MIAHYGSFEKLKAAGDTLFSEEGSEPPPGHISAFLDAATATGQVIGDPVQRRLAQDMVDFWFSRLLVSGQTRRSDAVPRLAPYADGQDPERKEPLGIDTVLQSRRLGDLAREWKGTKGETSYLLTGSALAQARDLVSYDEDIGLLVASSEAAMRSRFRRIILIGGSLMALVAAISVTVAVRENALRVVAEDTRLLAEERSEDAFRAQNFAERATVAALEAQAAAEADHQRALAAADDATRRLEDLRNTAATLDLALAQLQDLIDSDSLRASDLPASLAALLAPPPEVESFDFGSPGLNGYAADFLGPEIPLPILSPEAQEASPEPGIPLDYPNFSILYDPTLRLPLYSASNIDRSSLMVLNGLPGATGLPQLDDPRLGSADMVRSETWFRIAELEPVPLVAGTEIFWGYFFQERPSQAPALRDAIGRIGPIRIPQSQPFNAEYWSPLEAWSLTEHNRTARRVTVFAGPILDPAPSDKLGETVPIAYWKVAVSAGSTGNDRATQPLVVEAFIGWQQPGPNGEISGPFDPALRVELSEIEDRTGLIFPDILKPVDQTDFGPAAAEVRRLVALVPVLDGPEAERRVDAANQLLNFLGSADTDWVQRQPVIAALAELAQQERMLGLTATGRLNLFVVLSGVSPADWDRAEAVRLKARMRVALAELELREDQGTTRIGPQTRAFLEGIKEAVSMAAPSVGNVAMTLVGVGAEETTQLQTVLAKLRWPVQIGGQSGTGDDGTSRVRYRAGAVDEAAAAALLAADLREMGYSVTVEVDPAVELSTLVVHLYR